jgi:hypothetical protein
MLPGEQSSLSRVLSKVTIALPPSLPPSPSLTFIIAVNASAASAAPDPSAMDSISLRHDFNLLNYELEERQFLESLESQSALSVGHSRNEAMPSLLIALPLHVVYYILEFMVTSPLLSICLPPPLPPPREPFSSPW